MAVVVDPVQALATRRYDFDIELHIADVFTLAEHDARLLLIVLDESAIDNLTLFDVEHLACHAVDVDQPYLKAFERQADKLFNMIEHKTPVQQPYKPDL